MVYFAFLLTNIYRTPRGNLLQPRIFWRATAAIRFSGSAEVLGLLGTAGISGIGLHRIKINTAFSIRLLSRFASAWIWALRFFAIRF
ncbi:TPA: hypothetical protein SJ417_000381 [Yersinia enterocolitica]|nr:hypothetical protein [Yersinia enterocolitica]